MQRRELVKRYRALQKRNRDLAIDPSIALQAEHTMIRIEGRLHKEGEILYCETCKKPIPFARTRACPETIWCKACVVEYDHKRGKSWA